MNGFLILPYYLSWHYTRAFSDLRNLWRNFLLFAYHFFSIPILFRTLFSPWQRVHDGYGPGNKIMETFVFNTLMREIGFFIRLSFILIGYASMAILGMLGMVLFIVWLFLPIIMAVFAVWAVKMII